MHYEILDKGRQDILPKLEAFKDRFYLAGGTALALHIGHRKSVDFDFFCESDIDTVKLFEEIYDLFDRKDVVKVQEEKNTLGLVLHEDIKVSFMAYKYPMIKDFSNEEYLKVASVEDIAVMKLSAITGRATQKDYVDIYEILKQYSLSDLLEFKNAKLPSLDSELVLKSLVYFEDIDMTPIDWMDGFEVGFEIIKKDIIDKIKVYSKI